MKLPQFAVFFLGLVLSLLLALKQEFHAAYVVFFVAGAAAVPWSDYRPGVFSTNTIASDLQLTRVLDNAIVGLKAALAPLGLFSRAINRSPITPGNDADNSITVPVYAWGNGSNVQTRTPGQAYSSKVSNTSTGSRKILINTEKVIGIGFTNEEAQNQVMFDPVMHGLIKGHELALHVLQDIFSVVRYGNYPNATLAPMAATAFDVSDVASMGQKAMEAYWPQLPKPGLALNPGFYFNLCQQAGIIDASQSGSTDALRNAKINDVLGFGVAGSAGIPTNNGDGMTFTAATTDICTVAGGHGLLTGDQVQVSSGTTLPAGLAAATYYYVHKLSDTTFKLSTTLAGAVAGSGFVDITDTGTGTHTITLKTNLAGVAGAPSAIITGFRPVIPTAGIRKKLINFELVDDPETGLTLEFRHIADEDTGEEFQLIGVHYGKTYGVQEAMKLISTPAA